MKRTAPARIETPEDIEFLARSTAARRELIIDLRAVRWLSPLGVVAVLAAALSASVRNLQVSVLLPADASVCAYLEHVGFLQELRARGWQAPADLGSPSPGFNACHPVTPLASESAVEGMQARLNEQLGKQVPSANLLNAIGVAASELTANAREHGRIDDKRSSCYFMAQAYSGATTGQPGVTIAVADFGPGFAGTLADRYGRMSDVDAIRKGLEERVTSTRNPTRGLGLSWVRDVVEAHGNATLTIVSGSGMVSVCKDEVTMRELSAAFGGTLATAHFPCTLYTPATTTGAMS